MNITEENRDILKSALFYKSKYLYQLDHFEDAINGFLKLRDFNQELLDPMSDEA
jgi:hypothetical protein